MITQAEGWALRMQRRRLEAGLKTRLYKIRLDDKS